MRNFVLGLVGRFAGLKVSSKTLLLAMGVAEWWLQSPAGQATLAPYLRAYPHLAAAVAGFLALCALLHVPKKQVEVKG